jgi:hypothetical protein
MSINEIWIARNPKLGKCNQFSTVGSGFTNQFAGFGYRSFNIEPGEPTRLMVIFDLYR